MTDDKSKPWIVELYWRHDALHSQAVAAFETEAAATTWLEAGGLMVDDVIGPDIITWGPRQLGSGQAVFMLSKKEAP